MVEFEADDALATRRGSLGRTGPGVERIWICTPDKDLAQCVRGERVVMRDRRRERTIDEAGVRERWGVAPESIPDYLALVGDAADGFPGLPGWGARSAAAVLARFGHLEAIPATVGEWHVDVRSAAGLNATLRARWDEALLYRRLATLRLDVPLPQTRSGGAALARSATGPIHGPVRRAGSAAPGRTAAPLAGLTPHRRRWRLPTAALPRASPASRRGGAGEAARHDHFLAGVGQVEPRPAIQARDRRAGPLGDQPGSGHVPGG